MEKTKNNYGLNSKIEIKSYKYQNGTITIKTKQCTEKLYQCIIEWDFETIKCKQPFLGNEKKDTYYKIIQYEIIQCINSLKKIKCKRNNTKKLLECLIKLHQEISKQQFYQQNLF